MVCDNTDNSVGNSTDNRDKSNDKSCNNCIYDCTVDIVDVNVQNVFSDSIDTIIHIY
jgi:hypothetical protein